MSQAFQYFASGNFGRVRELLNDYQPVAGISNAQAEKQDLRGWEWRYLLAQTKSDELFTVSAAESCFRMVAFSPDGQMLAGANDDNSLRVWDWRTRKLVWSVTNTMDVTCVVFLPKVAMLAVGCEDWLLPGKVELWRFGTPAHSTRLHPLEITPKDVELMAFSFNGQMVAVAMTNRFIELWNRFFMSSS
jgi:WD40 repeat protein